MLSKVIKCMYLYRDDYRFKMIAADELLPLLKGEEATTAYAIGIIDNILSLEVQLGERTYANLLIDEIFQNGVPLPLTQTEKQIVLLLAEKINKLVTYNTIINEVWGYAQDNSILKVNVSNIRNKTDLEIESVKGTGYILKSVS